MVKSVLSLLIAVLMVGTLASCMEDPITSEEAVPQNIFRPNSIGFRFINYVPNSPTGSIRVYWSNSSSDAQANFGGYVARILTFDSVLVPGTNTYIQQGTVFAEKIVSKTTFEAIFDNVPVNEEYVFAVWGMRNPDPNNPDSLILSRDSVATKTIEATKKRILFDPRPLQNPTVIRAASIGPNSIRFEWNLPSSHQQGNILTYTIFYRDPSRLNDSAKRAGDRPYIPIGDSNGGSANYLDVTVPGAQVGQGVSTVKEYEFWIKTIRTDSTQFYDDSTLIRWSGGELISLGDTLGNSGLHLGQGLFFGNTNGRFGAEAVAADAEKALLKIDDAGENITVTGLNGTKFYTTYHGAADLKVAKFSAPLTDADYSETTLSLPKATPQGGWIIYAKLYGANNQVARILLRGAGSSLLTSGNTVSVSLVLQPKTTGADPLPYF